MPFTQTSASPGNSHSSSPHRPRVTTPSQLEGQADGKHVHLCTSWCSLKLPGHKLGHWSRPSHCLGSSWNHGTLDHRMCGWQAADRAQDLPDRTKSLCVWQSQLGLWRSAYSLDLPNPRGKSWTHRQVGYRLALPPSLPHLSKGSAIWVQPRLAPLSPSCPGPASLLLDSW